MRDRITVSRCLRGAPAQNARMRIIPICTLLVVGCFPAATSRRIRGPDGTRDWFAISCRGAQGNCYARAGDVCPGGYDMASESEREGAYVSHGPYASYAVPLHRGELLVHCHADPEATSEAPAPETTADAGEPDAPAEHGPRYVIEH